MSYKQAITDAMEVIARDPLVRFVGYGLKAGRAMGTLKGVSEAQLIETPVAENLMVGLATGLSLAGLRPVVFFERMDFILNAADAIVNHLDKIHVMSGAQFSPAVILRVVVGNRCKPLFTGETHIQEFTKAFEKMLSPKFCVYCGRSAPQIYNQWMTAKAAQQAGLSSMIVEYKDFL